MTLDKMRKRIDLLDRKLVNLLNLRAEITKEIGKEKINTGKSIYSPEREMQVLRKAASLNKGPLKMSALEAIYREIMSASLALEKLLKIAYMGPQASFSNLAALKRFGSQTSYVACGTIPEVFLEVERGAADYGVVPVENSIEGAVTHTLDMLVDSDLKICSQVILNVSHNLLANCAKNKIRKIYSNPQVFGQCRIWLQNNLLVILYCGIFIYEQFYFQQFNITKIFDISKEKREFLVVAREWVGWVKGNIFFGGAFCFAKYSLKFRRKIRPSKSFGGEAQAGGQKGRGVGGKEFLPACFRSRSV